jgi:ABC-2 type transport system permease protein
MRDRNRGAAMAREQLRPAARETRVFSATQTAWAFAAAVRLGWKVSSNWTRPFLFLIYSVLRPISAALILVVMYAVITGGRGNTRAYLAFLVVGTAFWSFVQGGVSEFAVGILEDRGRFKMLKYAYLAPQPFPLFLVGRATAKLLSAATSVALVLIVATVGLHLPIDVRSIDWPLLVAACLFAFIAIMTFSIALAVILLAGRDAYGYGEIMAQVLYIFAGAIFPIGVLPGPLAWLASITPLPYWLELARRAILHGRVYQMFPDLSDGEVLLRLAVATAGTVVLGWIVYKMADRMARTRGYIDMETSY